MTPQERVQRLREATAKATPGAWRQDEWWVLEENHESPIAHLEGHFREVDGNCEHIARWDPATAATVLDLVTSVLAEHAPCKTCPGGACHRCDESWPCVNGSFVLAVLDALDGGAS